jgi:hypothetical protein
VKDRLSVGHKALSFMGLGITLNTYARWALSDMLFTELSWRVGSSPWAVREQRGRN